MSQSTECLRQCLICALVTNNAMNDERFNLQDDESCSWEVIEVGEDGQSWSAPPLNEAPIAQNVPNLTQFPPPLLSITPPNIHSMLPVHAKCTPEFPWTGEKVAVLWFWPATTIGVWGDSCQVVMAEAEVADYQNELWLTSILLLRCRPARGPPKNFPASGYKNFNSSIKQMTSATLNFNFSCTKVCLWSFLVPNFSNVCQFLSTPSTVCIHFG